MLAVSLLAGVAHAGDDDDGLVPKNAATAHELPQIVIIGNTPLSGLGLPLNNISSNVQTADAQDLKRQQALDLAEFLNNSFSGVNVNESQGNPFQSDVNYHGFTASPLLGTPEGLSVYVDGVRVNEAFGDTVNWDLIPESAISTVTLMSGSNPVFGLNTLGGALAIQTKSGHANPGTELEAFGGSFSRRSFKAETGGEAGGFDYFLTGSYFDEDGWRDLSPTHLYQFFGKTGWQNETTDVDLSYTFADTSLTGNGTTPESLLAVRRAAILSAPDHTGNRLHFVNATGTQFLSKSLLLTANAYYRQLSTASNNGDVSDDNYLSDEYSGPPIDCSLTPDSIAWNAYCSNAINRSARLVQRTAGVGVQLTGSRNVFGRENQVVLGMDFNRSTDGYSQSLQYATLTPSRTAVSNPNAFNPAQTVNDLSGSNKILGVYATDTFSPTEHVHWTASIRYNRNTEILNGTSVDTNLADFGSGFGDANPLIENHTYSRVNPAVGFSLTPTNRLTVYANYNEASRAPTVIELGCSDPEKPCGLPNNFASDPNLNQVIARTVEIGARGNSENKSFSWSMDAFRTVNRDDIQFISTATSQGYFDNVGKTRRQGADLALGGRAAALSWRFVYSFVDATYQSAFSVNAGSNSSADVNGVIGVRPGNRIPLIARHTARLTLDYSINEHWDIGANLMTSAGVFLHGNENNGNHADGTSFLGSGWIGGYSVLNLRSTYLIGKRADVFVRVANVFDRHYATAGFLSSNPFTPTWTFRVDPDDWTHENAVSPAQPRAIWLGVRVHWE